VEKAAVGNTKVFKTARTRKVFFSLMSLVIVLVGAIGVGNCEPTTPTLDINFDVTEMFTWAQTIINAMLPVVYIIMGVALGFLIIRAFKAAFN